MTEEQRICLRGYVTLLGDFVTGRLDSAKFESRYLQKFKAEQVKLPESVFNVLDGLFADVDAYCSDPAIRGTDDLGDEDLLASAKSALQELERIAIA